MKKVIFIVHVSCNNMDVTFLFIKNRKPSFIENFLVSLSIFYLSLCKERHIELRKNSIYLLL